ncbi:MAG: indole-3-acetate monooxygenase [Pseudonocardiales bacterium]|nr:indole-3-acetate monooxygenase [Pseudonocardiales bacterium]
MPTDLVDDQRTGLEQVLEEIRAHAGELATADRLPGAVVRSSLDAGLYRLCLAGELGGPRVPLPDSVSVIEKLSYADGSVGWCTAVANVGAALLAGIDEAQAHQVAAEPGQLCIAGGFPPAGRGHQVGDSYRLTGHWSFASGCTAATWLLAGFLATPADPDGAPTPLVAFLPADQARIVPNWEVIGLGATGSHDVLVDAATVPVGRTTPLVGGQRWSADPIAAVPFFALGPLLGAVPLGIAARALDELLVLARTKVRFGQAQPLIHDQRFQDGFTAARVRLSAARSYLLEQAAEVWRTAVAGTVPPTAQAGATLALGAAAEAAVAAARFAHEAAGTASIRADSVLARCLNDATVATRHVAFSPFARQNAGRLLLGLPPELPEGRPR